MHHIHQNFAQPGGPLLLVLAVHQRLDAVAESFKLLAQFPARIEQRRLLGIHFTRGLKSFLTLFKPLFGFSHLILNLPPLRLPSLEIPALLVVKLLRLIDQGTYRFRFLPDSHPFPIELALPVL